MKLVKIEYFNTHWSKSANPDLMVDDELHKIFINVDHIARLGVESVKGHTVTGEKDLYFLGTNIPYSRGLNGVDYYSYYITPESYDRILKIWSVE